MKIELKRISYSERLSEETYAFSADLYINGKKVGEASNQGNGGPNEYGSYSEEGKKAIKEAEEYCKTLPPEKYQLEGQTRELERDLEGFIGDIIHNYVVEKDIQKFRKWVDKRSQDHMLVGKPDSEVNRAFRFKLPIKEILSGPRGAELLARAVERDVIPELKNGNMLLNNNIPESVLKAAGLKEGQYRKSEKSVAKNASQRKGKSI